MTVATAPHPQIRQVPYTTVFGKLLEAKSPVVVNVGGAGSSKSYSIAQLLVMRFAQNEGIQIGVCRKTFPALRITAYKLIVDLLIDYGYYSRVQHNKVEQTIRLGKSLIYFFSLDEPEKIKSAEFNLLWMEEANEFSYGDFIALKTRLRAPIKGDVINQIYLSLNPIDENNWIAKQLVTQEDVEVIHSTYHDNPFLDGAYIALLENLVREDPNYYRIYVLGEWGKLENLIYPRYRVVDEWPREVGAWAYGLDFGYVNPTALVRAGIRENEIYLEECLYQTHLTNSDLIERLTHLERADIYADSAEPQRIEEIVRAGHAVYPAEKDVQLGLDLVRRQNLCITKGSVNLLKEIRGYQRKVTRDGVVLEEPVKFNDHLMDATRYVLYGIIKRFGFPTASTASVGLPVWKF